MVASDIGVAQHQPLFPVNRPQGGRDKGERKSSEDHARLPTDRANVRLELSGIPTRSMPSCGAHAQSHLLRTAETGRRACGAPCQALQAGR
jgi:hypothetical protein